MEGSNVEASDNIFLIQDYITPQDDKVYRVWFIGGKIIAAVASFVNPSALFQGGCVGGVCSVKQIDYVPVFTAWDPPAEIQEKVLRAAKIAEADCGSVELLYDSQTGQAYYFDLNMVSTMPDSAQKNPVQDP